MAIQKITLTKIFRSDKNKEGQPLVTKDGRKYEKLAVKCKEHGDKWLSGFSGYWNQDWREGMIVGVEIETNGQYLNLKKPDPLVELEEKLTKRIELLEKAIFQNYDNQTEHVEGHVEDKNDLPF